MSGAGGARVRRWRPALLCALAGAAVFQFFGNAAYGYIKSRSLFWWWGYQWFNPGSETEHGLLILALSGWLVWRNLKALGAESGEKTSPAGGLTELRAPNCDRRGAGVWPAFAAMIGALGLHAVGFAAQQARVSVVALLIFAWGVLRLGGGRRWGAAALFPLGFLVLAIPFNALDSAGFWLRLGVIKASSGLAHAAGIGVFQNGTQLLAPDGRYSYDVAAACSGVRSLMALLALSLLIGYLNFRSFGRRTTLVALCFPLVYLGNVARIAAIVFAGHWAGQAWGERAHDVMGYGVFVIVLGGELAAAAAIRRVWPEATRAGIGKQAPGAEIEVRGSEIGTDPALRTERGSSAAGKDAPGADAQAELRTSTSDLREGPAWGVAGLVALLALGVMLFLGRLASRPPRGEAGVRLAADGVNPVALPVFLGTEWIGQRTEVTAAEHAVLPPDTGFSRMNYLKLADARQQVFLSIVLSGRDRSSIHRPELCVVGQGWTIRGVTECRLAATSGGSFPATVLHVERVVQTPRGAVRVPQLIVYWFVGGDTVEPTYWKRLVRDAWNRVVHARADRWAYVLMQSGAMDGDEAALKRMQAVLDRAMPAFARPPNPGDPR